MKFLIDGNETIDIINKFKHKHIGRLRNYGYNFDDAATTPDDAIYDAQTIKELEQIIAEIDKPVVEYEPVYNALKDLAGPKLLKGTMEYDATVKVIADFLGIDLEESNEDKEQGDEA